MQQKYVLTELDSGERVISERLAHVRLVAAFSSPPRPSKISAISSALWRAEPLKSRCSMKWETPAFGSSSSREPAPIQNPTAAERTCVISSEMIRSPESSSVST